MIPLSPALLLSAANALVGLDEDDLSGRLARIFLREASAGDAPPAHIPWDTAFVHHVGWWAHYDATGDCSSWPFVPSASCGELHACAEKRGALRTDPLVGDLFLLRSSVRPDFIRTGIVVRVGRVHTDPNGNKYRECSTIEGDSDELLRGTGGGIVRHRRQLSADRGDRFVRWTALDLRALRAREARRVEEGTWLKAA